MAKKLVGPQRPRDQNPQDKKISFLQVQESAPDHWCSFGRLGQNKLQPAIGDSQLPKKTLFW